MSVEKLSIPLVKKFRNIDCSIDKYYCKKCKCFHKRLFNRKVSITFVKHISFKTDISDSQIWKNQFSKSWKKYTVKKHQTSYSSNNQ
jgi:hypothetical protein